MAKKKAFTSTVIEPSQYVFETLREDEEFAFRRGRRRDGELATILLLAPVSEYPVPAILERLEHEYSLREEFDSEWAARPLTLVRREGRPMLILEDAGGDPLDRLLGQPMELSWFLRIAVGLASTLSKLHHQGLIHKDIKPANILVDSASGATWLTGFGMASRLPRERQSAEPPEMIAGTLAYMAPEQTGRMNRSIDSRSDLYSLGVTFYEMLTGVLPFIASDPMEWVHCHIARQPVPPDQCVKEIPAPLSAIVMKLLAKTAEERYQTAAGVARDLRDRLKEWEAHRRIEPFQLAAHDVSNRLLIPEKLYGREREIDALLASFDHVVANGNPELVLVSGYSGIGKSSVVHELHKALVPPRGLFASGKFDQYKRDIPYTTLGQAFQSLVRPLLGWSEAELAWWRDTLREALGPNGQLIVNLVPALELVIGEQPPVPDLPPQDAQNRFQMVFRQFLGVFARKEHPLALFLDDLQWVDTATLDLLDHLVTHAGVRHLLLVGAYRDNEVSPAHPLLRTLEAIRNAGARVHEIVLAPLGVSDVGRLVSDALHCRPNRARLLAQLVHEKTGGNPFFAIQFFTALTEERLLTFDPDARAWAWDIGRIRAKSYTDNVVDLMAAKLRRFSATTQEALKQLACLGNAAEIATLTLVHREPAEAVHAALWEAVHAGLVFRERGAYKFLHDRIQQAAYTLIPEEQRAEFHLRIGRVLLASMTADELAEHLFEVANQFSRGAERLVDRDEKAQVATIDLRAGRKAKASAAFASACVYLAAGVALLDERDWGSQYDLMFSLRLERAECEFLTGNFDAAEQLIGELLQRGASKVDQAAAYHLKVLLHTVKSENAQAIDAALTCLRLFSIDLPVHPEWELVQTEYETLWQTLNGRPIESLIALPLITDPELQAAMRVLSVLQAPAHITDFHLLCLLVCRMVNISMQAGMSGASAHGYALLGYILGPVFHRYSEGYRFAKLACDLVEKHGFIAYQAKVYHAMGTVALWTQPIGTAIYLMRKTFRTAIEVGDLTFACYSMALSVTALLLRNDLLDAMWRESERGLDFVRKTKFRDVADIIVSQQRFIATMQGRTASFSTFSDAQFDESTFEAQLTGERMTLMICFYWIVKLKTRFLSRDYAEALAAADKARAVLWSSTTEVQLLDYFYYTALTVAALYEKASADEQVGWRDLLMEHSEQLREWAENYPPTFGDKYALVSAEFARIEKRDFDALRLYEEAIRAARENGFVQNEALAYELAASFHAARGFEDIAHLYVRKARYGYLRWGADGKVRQLDEMYPDLREKEPAPGPAGRIGAPVEHLDLATVIKVSQAISGEIVLSKLINKLMRIALEQAGAEHGLLILTRGKEQRIEAEASSERDRVTVHFRQSVVPVRHASASTDAGATPSELPESLLRYVIRTLESVTLSDASVENLFSEDEYIRRKHPRSVFCLPLIKQGKLVGVLYLENNLAPGVFTAKQLAILELIASEAAISLEQARLYAELSQENSERRKADEALRASEERWRKLFENSSAGIALIRLDGRLFAANYAFQKMLGYTEQELHRLTSQDLTIEEDRPADEALRAEAVAGHWRDYRVERRFRRKDGSVVWTDVSAVSVPTAESESGFFAAVIVDISERKQAEEELRRSEAFLAQGERISHTGSWRWQVATGSVYWSKEHFRVFGYDPETDSASHSLFLERIHPEDRGPFEELLNRAVQDQSDFENHYRIVLPGGSIKFVRSVGQALVSFSGELEFIGTVMDVTDLKRAEEMQIAIAREREMLMRQRAAELAKANEALRSCLDALASVPELDAFIGQVMGAITRQLGAVSSNLRLLDVDQKGMRMELLFQDSSVILPEEAGYPERFQSVSLEELGFASLVEPYTAVNLSDPRAPGMSADLRDYLQSLGVRTLLRIPLLSQGRVNGVLSFRFAEERDFQMEELEIARALATQASLAIHLTELARSAKQSAVLEERTRLAGEIHDSLAQCFTGITMQLELAKELKTDKDDEAFSYLERANDLARFGLAEARRSVLSLQSMTAKDSGLIESLQILAERSNIAGRLRCTFRSNLDDDESVPVGVRQDLLRIAQEAISNALRHAKSTAIRVDLRSDPPNLILKVNDNGIGITTAAEAKEGFGFVNMRARVKKLKGTLDIRTVPGHGTNIIVRVPFKQE
jgi:PAS domain S-box-containing protein